MRFAWLAVLVAACGDDPVHQLPDGGASADAPVDADPCRGGKLDDGLRHGIARWTVAQTTPSLFTVTTDADGIHVVKTGTNPGGFQSISFTIPLQIDALEPELAQFTLAVDFANAAIGPNEDQIELHPIFDDGSTFFAVYSDHGGTGREVHVWDGSTVQASTATSATGGTLEVDLSGAPIAARFSGTTIYANATIGPILRGVAFTLNLQPGSDDAAAVDFTGFHATWTCAVPI